jgi:HSP20 family protein
MSRSSQWRRVATSPLHLLQHELNRLLEDYLQPERYAGSASPPTDLDPMAWSPAVDVYETAEDVVILAEVPGVDPAAIDLAVNGNLLSLRGSKEPGAEQPESVAHARERRFGAFHRQVTLPNDVDTDKAQAEATNGVLKIRLPKRSADKPRTIPIRPQ